MNTWPEILADCDRLLSWAGENIESGKPPVLRSALPEAAFRITLRRNAESGIELKSIVGGIPKIVSCVVHPVTSQPHARWLSSDDKERPAGVVIRHARREDLYIFYRACDASLVLYTLPERRQSEVIVVPLEDTTEIRQSTLGGNVCRIAFDALAPGRYLVASFSKVRVDELHSRAKLLRKQGLSGNALALVEEILELDPDDFEGWTRKGCLLRDMGRRDEAMVALKKALEKNPECALAWRLKGALHRDASEHRQGLNCYLRSLKLDPTDFLCWENKGNALTALDRTEEAKEAYAEAERVKKLYPEQRY
jgi:tetratricopeptide (TPR) repeat protein